VLRRVRAGPENGLSGDVGANRILAEDGTSVRRVAEDGDGQRKAGLDLVDGRKDPVMRKRTHETRIAVTGML